MRKNKLLICALALSTVLTVLPGMTSVAAGAEGETDASAGELQDENVQRLEEVTAMDEDGSIYEIDDTDGTVDGAESNGISTFALRMASVQVVNFNKNGSTVTYYTDEINGGTGYTNGAYGADAAYLGTTSDGRIRFMLSGVTGSVNASDVQLVDYDTVADNVSYYQVSGGKLYHYISQNLNNAPSSSINNGPAPAYLSESVKYYSYDGHYFYTDYSVMLSDYQTGSNGISAVNAGNPFYNYFQFLNMTTSTAYSGEELNSILNTAMTNAGIDPGSSKLTGTGNSFVNYQNTYSVNALLSLGIAINESGWGRSNICMTKNNIFGLNAADSATENADTFASIDTCIRDFMANWMAGGYLDSSDWRNNGEYLGSKAGGINVRYASDPYWGEKAAAHAWNLDTVGGSWDYPGTDSTEGTGSTPADEPAVTPPEDTTPPIDTTPSAPPAPPVATTPSDTSETTGTTGTPETPDVTDTPETSGDGSTPDDELATTPPEDITTPSNTTVSTPVQNTITNTSGADGVETDDTQDTILAASPAEETTADGQANGASSDANSVKIQPVAASDINPAVASPKTGDSVNAAVWAVLIGVSALTGIMMLTRKRNMK